MSLPQLYNSPEKERTTDSCFSTSPQNNKRELAIDTDPNILSSTTSLENVSTDEFASSTPLKKKRALFNETKTNDVPYTTKPLLEDFKQSNVEHTNGINNNVHAKPITHISGQSFKDIIYRCFYEDFCNSYKKLNSRVIPDCCNLETCDKKHKNLEKRAITTFSNGTFFSILDNPLENWLYDISTAAFSILRPELFFSSDVLRILFDYILNGPEENLVWDVKHIISSHFELHPPCMGPMRQFYLSLLSQAHNEESYFKTELVNNGILNHIINRLEEGHELIKPLESEEQGEDSQENVVDIDNKTKEDEDQFEEITFEIMEQRWNNFEPLLDREYNEVVGALDDLRKSTPEEDELVIKTNKTMPRLAIALELIIDILEADFMIFVSKLKKYISSESTDWVEPIIKHFMNENLHHRIFLLYVKTTDQALWTQLSRLIAVMAEFEHLFESPQQLWHYPSLNPQCERFTTYFFNYFNKCEWSEEERLMRLEILQPPWLRLKSVMHWINSDLKLAVGSDLKALVDTLHMHVISPMKLEKDSHFKVNDIAVNNRSPEFIKKANKKNAYGETMLHRICKDKKGNNSMLFILLSLPVDVNAKDNYGWTPLHEAVLTESVFKTKILLQYQPPPGRVPVDLGAQNSQGSTPLHEAVIAKNLDICKLLVDYGGACLLRKTDCAGVTPLHLAKAIPDINRFFDRVIKTQELLNLSPDSVLNMSEFVVQLLVLACDAFLDDHHTWRVYNEMKFNPTPKKLKQKNWIIVDQQTLLNFRKDQDQFRKLRKILNKLAENSKNSCLIKLWDSKYQNVFF